MRSLSITRVLSGTLIEPRRWVNLNTPHICFSMIAMVFLMANSASFALWVNAKSLPIYTPVLLLALAIWVPAFIYWALRGELTLKDKENDYKPLIFHTVGAMTCLVVLTAGCLGVFGTVAKHLPINNAGIGNYTRHSGVVAFVSNLQERGKSIPEELRGDYTNSLAQLRQAYTFVNSVYSQDKYKRAMLSMALLELKDDPVYVAGKENGWLTEGQINELAGRVREIPPDLTDGALRQQAYLRLIGEVSMNSPFQDVVNEHSAAK